MRSLLLILGLAAALGTGLPAFGQEATTAPAEAPRERHALVLPEGFEIIEAAGRRAVATADDAAWVREVLEQVDPPARPTTMPADVVERALARRDQVVEQLGRELAIEQTAPVAEMFDNQLLPALRQIESAEVPLFYIVADSDVLKARLKAGWTDPRFRYNRAADEIMINQRLDILTDRPMDDTLLPVLNDAPDPIDARRTKLRESIQTAEQGVAQELSKQAQLRVHFELVQFIEKMLLERFDYKPDQVWFRLGVSASLASRHASTITGSDPLHFVLPMVVEPRNARVRAATVDLLAPTELSSLRREYVGAYMDALRRKSVAAVFDWLKKAPEGALPKVLVAIHDTQPADGEAIARLIQEQTGIDVTPDLKPLP